MGFFILKRKAKSGSFEIGRIVCKSVSQEKLKELGVLCTYILQVNAERAIEKLKDAGIDDYEVGRGYCSRHFDYNGQVKEEYKEQYND